MLSPEEIKKIREAANTGQAIREIVEARKLKENEEKFIEKRD